MKRRTVDYVKSILVDGIGGQVGEMICMVLRCQKNSLLNKQSGARESEKIGIHAKDVNGRTSGSRCKADVDGEPSGSISQEKSDERLSVRKMFGEYVEVDTSGRTDVDEETGGRIVQGNPDDKLIDARKMSDEMLRMRYVDCI